MTFSLEISHQGCRPIIRCHLAHFFEEKIVILGHLRYAVAFNWRWRCIAIIQLFMDTWNYVAKAKSDCPACHMSCPLSTCTQSSTTCQKIQLHVTNSTPQTSKFQSNDCNYFNPNLTDQNSPKLNESRLPPRPTLLALFNIWRISTVFCQIGRYQWLVISILLRTTYYSLQYSSEL